MIYSQIKVQLLPDTEDKSTLSVAEETPQHECNDQVLSAIFCCANELLYIPSHALTHHTSCHFRLCSLGLCGFRGV